MKSSFSISALSLTAFVLACAPKPSPSETANAEADRIATLDGPALCRVYGESEPPKWTAAAERARLLAELEIARRDPDLCDAPGFGAASARLVGLPRYARVDGPAVGSAGDRDCADFASEADAQAFFLRAGGPAADPHDLDRDGDGFACEWGAELRRVAAPAAPAAPSAAGECYVGPRGGTYTLTASGRKNYSGC